MHLPSCCAALCCCCCSGGGGVRSNRVAPQEKVVSFESTVTVSYCAPVPLSATDSSLELTAELVRPSDEGGDGGVVSSSNQQSGGVALTPDDGNKV